MNVLRGFVALALGAVNASAQCAMCQTAAAAQGQAAAKALNAGILILFVPAIAAFCGVFLFAFKCRDLDER